jgi:hypothetical protein
MAVKITNRFSKIESCNYKKTKKENIHFMDVKRLKPKSSKK